LPFEVVIEEHGNGHVLTATCGVFRPISDEDARPVPLMA
jgi:hypothetical protein